MAVAAGCGSGRKAAPAHCSVLAGPGAYDSDVRPSSGPAGSTITVSGRLPVVNEAGQDVGQTANRVDVYWNLAFRKWWTALGPSPLASVPGSAVKLLGKQGVANRCTYRIKIEIPSVPPGRYPIEVLSQAPDKGGPSTASFAPANFEVTGG